MTDNPQPVHDELIGLKDCFNSLTSHRFGDYAFGAVSHQFFQASIERSLKLHEAKDAEIEALHKRVERITKERDGAYLIIKGDNPFMFHDAWRCKTCFRVCDDEFPYTSQDFNKG